VSARISVIVPTIGRETLDRALESAAVADEVIVERNQDGDHGYAARMRGMARATGTHLAFLDDDDVYAPGAIETMRAAACDRPVIFRMDDPTHGIIWKRKALDFGNVGTPMFLVPNEPDRLGRWEPYAPGLKCPGGDFMFISDCAETMGAPVWREEVVAIVAPDVARSLSITVVTPWLNHRELEQDYWAAIDHAGPCAVIVLDNGSDPPLGFATVRLDKNRGFAYACNDGLRMARTDAVLFLNNDIAALEDAWLGRITAALEPGVLVGAELRHDRHGDIDGIPLPYLDGWCLAGMTADLRELEFDEEFREPSYYGDNDLCFRARLAGMRLREVRVGLRHKGNVTAGPPSDPDVIAATLANRALFAAKVRRELVTT